MYVKITLIQKRSNRKYLWSGQIWDCRNKGVGIVVSYIKFKNLKKNSKTVHFLPQNHNEIRRKDNTHSILKKTLGELVQETVKKITQELRNRVTKDTGEIFNPSNWKTTLLIVYKKGLIQQKPKHKTVFLKELHHIEKIKKKRFQKR